MKVFRIIMLSVLGLVDAYSLYAVVGYIILGIQTPKLVGNTTTVFTGMYIMAMTFFLIALVCTTLIIVIAKKLKKSKVNK